MGKTRQSFSCDWDKWQALEPIAKKFKMSRNELISFLVARTLETGEIEPKTEVNQGSIESQLKAEQLIKAKNANSVFEINKRNLEAKTKITEYHAKHLDAIGAKPSSAAFKAMEHQVNQTQPYDEDAIHCPDCNWHTNSKDSMHWQIDSITNHVKSAHKRNFTESEAQTISELLV